MIQTIVLLAPFTLQRTSVLSELSKVPCSVTVTFMSRVRNRMRQFRFHIVRLNSSGKQKACDSHQHEATYYQDPPLPPGCSR